MNISITNVGPINNANVDINKINVVGGVNSSGKSIISKILYCYLKSIIDDESIDFLMDSEGISNIKDAYIIIEDDFNPSEIFYIDSISEINYNLIEF